MTWLYAIWEFIKGIPWQAWALAGLLAGGWYYGHLRFNAGQQQVQIRWDAQKAKDKALADKINADYRAREQAERLAAAASRRQYDEDIARGNQEAATLRADLLSAKRRVRNVWRPGQCDVPNDHAPVARGESQADLQAASIERIDRALAAGEAQVNLLITRYEQAEKVCGTTH